MDFYSLTWYNRRLILNDERLYYIAPEQPLLQSDDDYQNANSTLLKYNDSSVELSAGDGVDAGAYTTTGTFTEEHFNVTVLMNFSCTDAEPQSDDLWSSVYFKSVVYLLYIPIFIFALLGNGTVCYIVQSTPRMRTVTNYFIANLALGDILMSLFCVPPSFISQYILNYWPFGIVLCHFVNYSQVVSVLVSAYTLVAISIDRYIAIMWPLRPRITKR